MENRRMSSPVLTPQERGKRILWGLTIGSLIAICCLISAKKQIEVDDNGILWWQDTREDLPPQIYWEA